MGKKTKAVKARKPAPSKISEKSTKISKEKSPKKIDKKPAAEVIVPTAETDIKLKEIVEKTTAIERKEEQEEAAAEMEQPDMEMDEPEVKEKVKVKRKESLIKKKSESSNEKSFISLTNPEEDNKQIKVPKSGYKKNRGVVYLGHIPHGFFEKQMREFFSQFGTVTNLRLGRSRKTGGSRGFAFIEFKFLEVAKIVAETMNNYLMFNKLMKASLMPQEKCHPKLFMGKINPDRPPLLVSRRAAKKIHNSVKCEETSMKRAKRIQNKAQTVQDKLAAAGIDYQVQIS